MPKGLRVSYFREMKAVFLPKQEKSSNLVKGRQSLRPGLSLESERPGEPSHVGPSFELGSSVDDGRLVAERLQLSGKLDRLLQPVDHVELLPRLRVQLELELHRVRPRALATHQRDLKS